jgi:hypothetical protein
MDPGKILGIVGLAAYLVVGWVPYLVSGLVVPGLALVLLWAVWVAGLVWAWRTFRARARLDPGLCPRRRGVLVPVRDHRRAGVRLDRVTLAQAAFWRDRNVPLPQGVVPKRI